MKRTPILFLTQAAAVAALYVALTYLSFLLGLANGAVQLRLSEALCVLPFLTPAAVPGLFVGCLLANLLTGCAPWDILLGSLATLAGAAGCRALRHQSPYLAALPTIAANTAVIPPVLQWVYGVEGALPLLFLTVGAGEVLSCGVLGTLLLLTLRKKRFPWLSY
ncbi:MAG: QueT transporter family protein [Eubacteriales bacterium]